MTVKDIDFNRIYKDQDNWYFIPEKKDNLYRVRWVYIRHNESHSYSEWENWTDSGWVSEWIATEFTKDEIAAFKLWLAL